MADPARPVALETLKDPHTYPEAQILYALGIHRWLNQELKRGLLVLVEPPWKQ